MQKLALMLCVCLQLAPAAEPGTVPQPDKSLDAVRKAYRADAEKYHFFADEEKRQPLELAPQPIMRWANDDDWSGDVFVWTLAKRPAVVGCILSGPADSGSRLVFHEFHLLAEKPLAAADLQTGRRWKSQLGLTVQPVPDAPAPAKTAVGRLTQMRQMSRDFTAHMQAEGEWELRSLPQPLFRYGDEEGTTVDGALFSYVWTKGTDPEVILMIECRKTQAGLAWYYAPVRFSNRPVWLKSHGKEVWRVESHREPGGKETDLIYTTAYSGTLPAPIAADQAKPEPAE